MSPYDLFLSSTSGYRPIPVKPGFERAGRCYCPAHQPSPNKSSGRTLSIAESDSGALFLHCHAGCSVTEIVGAIGLKLHDLFPSIHDPVAHLQPAPAVDWHSAAAAAGAISELAFSIPFCKTREEMMRVQIRLEGAVLEFNQLAKNLMKQGENQNGK